MLILVSADWHLSLNRKNIPNDWASNRYRLLFKDIYILEKQVDLHVIAGDLFEKSPSMEELALYFEFISKCSIRTLILPGNHCATKKGFTFLTSLKEVTQGLNPLVEIIDDYYSNDTFDIIPYNKLKEFNPNNFHNSILFTHCRASIPPFVKPEIDLNLFNRWTRVYLGDLHSYENSQLNLVYPGAPVATSFHRQPSSFGVLLVDTSDCSHEWVELKLPQLIRKTIKVGEPTTEDLYDRVIFEIEGDLAQLGSLQDNELVSKRIVKRSVDTALMLEPEMSLEEEVSEYLKYILEINEESIETILQELADHVKKA